MRFHSIVARFGWQRQFEQLGYSLQPLVDPSYWMEALEKPFCAVFDRMHVELIEKVTLELNELGLQLVDHVCTSAESEALFDVLQIPGFFREAVRQSWSRRDSSLYGRYDLAYDGETFKLLEMNFDVPTSLYETAALQELWYEDLRDCGVIPKEARQFNVIRKNLAEGFVRCLDQDEIIYFSSFYSEEDVANVRYLQSRADCSGLRTSFAFVDELAINENGYLVDRENSVVTRLFKLYPWELLIANDQEAYEKRGSRHFTRIVQSNQVKIWEPAWKSILSNKAVLALLWQLHPDHQNLLETYIDSHAPAADDLRSRAHVKKPIFGRGGENVSVVFPNRLNQSESAGGECGKEGFVLQAFQQLPIYDQYHMVVGSWMVNGQASGIGIRADLSQITGANAIFVPHYVID